MMWRAVVLGMVLLLLGCSSNPIENQLLGRWGEKKNGWLHVSEFKAGGVLESWGQPESGSLKRPEKVDTGTWKLDGKNLILSVRPNTRPDKLVDLPCLFELKGPNDLTL